MSNDTDRAVFPPPPLPVMAFHPPSGQVKHEVKIIKGWAWNFGNRMSEALNDGYQLMGAGPALLGLRWRAFVTKATWPEPPTMTAEEEAELERQNKEIREQYAANAEQGTRINAVMEEMLVFAREARAEMEERRARKRREDCRR